MKLKVTLLTVLGMTFVTPVFAVQKTVSLSVPGMFCASCPYIVQAAIGDVDGDQSVITDLDTRTAFVIFVDEIATLDNIIVASTFVGYEAFLIKKDTDL